jgi:hypothetical protein
MYRLRNVFLWTWYDCFWVVFYKKNYFTEKSRYIIFAGLIFVLNGKMRFTVMIAELFEIIFLPSDSYFEVSSIIFLAVILFCRDNDVGKNDIRGRARVCKLPTCKN